QLEGENVAIARGRGHAAERRAMGDARAWEGGDVEVDGFLRLLVEPQMRGDGLHGTTSSVFTRLVIARSRLRQLLQPAQISTPQSACQEFWASESLKVSSRAPVGSPGA